MFSAVISGSPDFYFLFNLFICINSFFIQYVFTIYLNAFDVVLMLFLPAFEL